MSGEEDFEALTQTLSHPQEVISQAVALFARSSYRGPNVVDTDAIAAAILPLVEELAVALAPDRNGAPTTLVFTPGRPELREVEQAVVFLASQVGTRSRQNQHPLQSGFDLGALLFALRDVLAVKARSKGLGKILGLRMHRYWEWLVVLAGDSMAHSRVQSAQNHFQQELDEGTPLLMVTSEVPAAIFLASPNTPVIEGVLSRLLLTVVRTSARAAILHIQGMSAVSTTLLIKSLDAFCKHPRISETLVLYLCGIAQQDRSPWHTLAQETGVSLAFENTFDLCVAAAVKCGGGRIIPGNS